MLKKFLIGTFALALMLSVGVLTASAFSGATLKVGSRGADVIELQTKLSLKADGVFGPMTKAAVMAFQASNGLTADGVVGPMTLAKLTATVVGGTYPAGCTSNTGFSSTTGQSCAVSTTLPAGCTSTVGFSPTTGAKCDGGSTPGTTGPLVGGAGELIYSSTTSDLESDVKEGATEKVLATRLEADDSDISVNNIKVSFENDSGNGSTRFEKYIDEVVVMLGSTEVGSADADEFSKDGTEYSKSISLSNAVIRNGDKVNLYVAVKALSTVDDDTAEFDAALTQIRWMDATGALFSDVDSVATDFGTGAVQTFGFDEANVDDSLEVKSSSANPDDSTVKVDESDSTDDVLALAFKFDVDEDSADVSVTYMEMVVAFENYDTDLDGDVTSEATTDDSAAEAVVEELLMKVNGEEYEFDLESVNIAANGTGSAIYSLDLDEGELVIDSDSTEEAKVYLTLADQDDNYNDGLIVYVTVDVDEIQAETENDELSSVDGSDKTGGELTLSLTSAVVTVTDKDSEVNEAATIGTFSFTFKVEADGDSDVVFDAGDVLYEVLGPANDFGTGSAVLTFISGDATDVGGTMTVDEGGDAIFTFDVTVNPDAGDEGSYRVRLTDVAGVDLGDSQLVGPRTLTN